MPKAFKNRLQKEHASPQRVIEVVVDSLGYQGDGFGQLSSGERIGPIPLCAPGDHVRVQWQPHQKEWRIVDLLQASEQRQDPPCPYFGTCGGCQLQHLNQATYQQFKLENLERSLTFHGIRAYTLDPMVAAKPQQRRRVTLKVQRVSEKSVLLGYYQRRSHHIVDIDQCLLIDPDLEALLHPLRTLHQHLLSDGQKAEVSMTKTNTGLDVVLELFSTQSLSLDHRELLVNFARDYQLARLSLLKGNAREPVVVFKTPQVQFGDTLVAIEPGSFLQATPETDMLFDEMISSAPWGTFRNAADLFSGRGTLTFPLARKGPVDAFELEAQAVADLNRAALATHQPIRAVQRQLFDEPLTLEELTTYDVVVLDPPRQGALSQVRLLAQSPVPHVFMVSCNIDTFARDAAILVAGGYRMGPIKPMDQFLWSPHLELAAFFQKAGD